MAILDGLAWHDVGNALSTAVIMIGVASLALTQTVVIGASVAVSMANISAPALTIII